MTHTTHNVYYLSKQPNRSFEMTSINHHPSDSIYLETQKLWNPACKAKRQRMLEQAGLNKNDYYARAFAFLPKWIRDSLMDAYRESMAIKQATKQKPTRNDRALLRASLVGTL